MEVSDIEALKLPYEIENRIQHMHRIQHTAGMSGALVYTYYNDKESFVLKIQKEDRARGTHIEREMLPWLYGKVAVPKVWYAELIDDISYILMDVVPGSMANDAHWLSKGEDYMIERLAAGLLCFWEVDIAGCPAKHTLKNRLQIAADRVANNIVNTDVWVEYNTFATPAALLQHLTQAQPQAEDYVIVQGDYCLPNIFLDEAGISGFIDLGRAGIADRYQDIALCIRTLSHNFGFAPLQTDERIGKLFSHLKIEPDYSKIEYFLLLNELF